MKAYLKHLDSPDVELATYCPEDESNFGFYLEATIGPEGGESEEVYGMQVCTPSWLASQHAKNSVVFGRHLVIVFDYSFERIEGCIREYVEKCTGEDWKEVSVYLSRIGLSEFEDYVK